MIDLFKVKINNSYDFIQDTLPASNGTWLCSLTAGSYTRGYSYQVNGSHATRIEELQDTLILANRFEVIETTLQWLNNPFYVRRQQQSFRDATVDYYMTPAERIVFERYHADASEYTFSNSVITGVNAQPFAVGDLVQLTGALRNNLYAYVTASSSGTITIENGNVRDTTENAVIFLVTIPESVEYIFSKMVWWNVFKRVVSDLRSESIGNYSYEKEEQIAGFAYPRELVAELQPYKKVRFNA